MMYVKKETDERDNDTCRNETSEHVEKKEMHADMDDNNLDVFGNPKVSLPKAESQTKKDYVLSVEDPILKSVNTQIKNFINPC